MTKDRTKDQQREWQQYWDSSGLYVHALRRGNPLLILLHGIGDGSESLLPLAQALGDDFDCIVPDLRGHGFSPRCAQYTATDYAEDLSKLVSACDTPVYLYGHSLGGLLALWLAGEMGNSIAGCVLEDPPLFHLQASIHQRPDVVKAFAGMHSLLQQQLDPHALLRALETIFPQAATGTAQRAQICNGWIQRCGNRYWRTSSALACPRQIFGHKSAHLHLLMADPRGAALMAGDEAAIAQRCAQLTSECIRCALPHSPQLKTWWRIAAMTLTNYWLRGD